MNTKVMIPKSRRKAILARIFGQPPFSILTTEHASKPGNKGVSLKHESHQCLNCLVAPNGGL